MKKILLISFGLMLLAVGCNKAVAPSANLSNNTNTPPTNTASADPTASWTLYHVPYGFDIKYPKDTYKANVSEGGYNNLATQLAEFSTDGIPRFPKTNFADAAVTIGYDKAANESVCLTMKAPENSSGFSIPETINGLKFFKATASGVGAGNIYTQRLFRTYRNGDCLEIVETIHTGNIGNYPAGTVTEVNKEPIWNELDLIAHSITFKN